jgi:hypothetical protein
VDELLGGGFEMSSQTEIFGKASWYVVDGVWRGLLTSDI